MLGVWLHITFLFFLPLFWIILVMPYSDNVVFFFFTLAARGRVYIDPYKEMKTQTCTIIGMYIDNIKLSAHRLLIHWRSELTVPRFAITDVGNVISALKWPFKLDKSFDTLNVWSPPPPKLLWTFWLHTSILYITTSFYCAGNRALNRTQTIGRFTNPNVFCYSL